MSCKLWYFPLGEPIECLLQQRPASPISWHQHQWGLRQPGQPPSSETPVWAAFSASLRVRSHHRPGWTPAISPAAINGYLAEAIEHYRTREEVLWLRCMSLLCSSMSLPDILYNYLLRCRGRNVSQTMSNAKSAFSTQNLISFLHFFFFLI